MATVTYPVGSKVYYTPAYPIYPTYGVILEAKVPIPAVVLGTNYSAAMNVWVYEIMLLSGMRYSAYDYQVSISKPGGSDEHQDPER